MTPTTTGTRSRPAASAKGAVSARGSGRAIDPRIRARRSAVTRQQGRRRLRVLLIGMIGTAVLIGLWLVVAHTSLLAARAVTVVGATHETSAQVIAAAGLDSRPPLLDVNTASAARAIEALPWVRTAAVRVQWPDGVRIVVTEETPRLAAALANGQWAALAADGRVLSVGASQPPGLLVLHLLTPPGTVGSTLSPKDAAGLKVGTTLPASFAAQVTAVTMEPGGWVQLAMTTPVVVNIGTATQLPDKYEDVSSILAGATLHSGDVIDVSVPRAPTVTGG
jgi:cell division protein FtsQ